MSGDNVLAQRIAEDNKDLKAQVGSLTDTNEALEAKLKAYEALGTVDDINEKLEYANTLADAADSINESFQDITEQFGSNADILESLTTQKAFVEKHGDLDQVEEALSAATTQLTQLQEFVESHGPLDQVATTLTRMAGAVDQITENANLAARAREFQEQRGTFDIVESALDKAGVILGDIHEAKQAETYLVVAESYGKSVDELKDIMESFNLDLNQVEEAFTKFGIAKIEESKDGKDGEDKMNEDDKKDEDDDKVEESFARPARLKSLVTGSSFLHGQQRDFHEDKQQDIDESNKPSVTNTSRLANMVR